MRDALNRMKNGKTLHNEDYREFVDDLEKKIGTNIKKLEKEFKEL